MGWALSSAPCAASLTPFRLALTPPWPPFRFVPYKRSVAIGLSAMGSTGLAVLRWLTGHWLPSWAHLSQNPIFQGYVVLSALLGAALTYYFDDRSNPKLNTLILVRHCA